MQSDLIKPSLKTDSFDEMLHKCAALEFLIKSARYFVAQGLTV